MKIVVVCEVLGEPNNGTTVAAYNLIRRLKESGHEVTVVCPDKDKEGQDGFVILPRTHMGFVIDPILEKNNVILTSYDEKILRAAFEGADAVHIMVPLFIARKTSKLVKSMGIPLTCGFHAQAENLTAHVFGCMNCKLANRIVYRWYDKNLYRRADAIHYPTQFIRDVFEKEVGRTTPGYVISNGVNARYTPGESERAPEYRDKFCILFTGRLSKEKSHLVLLKAVARSKHKDKIQLFFAGQGPQKKHVVKWAKKHLENQPVIAFYSREDLVKLIRSCDLYCHPAAVEIEAISCLEAICCGLVPIIANSPRCATKAFALDERSLFPVGDSKALAEKIDYMIEHPEEAAVLREKYLSGANRFEQEACMEEMEKMIVETAEKARAKA